VTDVWTIVTYGMREALRKRVFAIVLVLTVIFLGLFALANHYVFRDLASITPPEDVHVDTRTFAGTFLFGLAMFATLFLGVVLAVFLTLGVVSGDAERGLLQPLVVRPIGRSTLLVARFLGAAVVCAGYVLAVYFAAMAITGAIGDWWPDRVVAPGVELAAAAVLVAALSLAGSVVLSGTANGIAVFMLFGAGLTAGLLGQIGQALGSDTLDNVSRVVSWALPFEALYQSALAQLTADTVGFTRLAIDLGPFGGAESAGVGLWPWTAAYLVLVGVGATVAFARRDL
jgi:ABC-type transport system involved in multi-copper enzyme maturation permease subunit